jgi:lipopolysaccharide export system permease protein
VGRTLDRYVLREIVPLFLFGVAGFVLFFMIFDAFDRLDVFVDNKTPFKLIFSYYLNSVPYNAVLVAPMAMLLSTFRVFGQLSRFNEVTAMKTAGLSLYRVFLPVALLALLVSGISFVVGEKVMPQANRIKKKIYEEQIRGRPPRQSSLRTNLNYLGDGGRVYAVRRFDVRQRQLQEVVVQEFAAGRLTRRVDARLADWVDHRWIFRDGVLRTFRGVQETATPFDTLSFPEFVETPEDLARDEADPDQLSWRELDRYAARLADSGRPAQKYQTEKHLKVAFPFVNLMAALIAMPLATRLRRGGVAIGFGLSFLLFVAYIGLVRLGQVFGHNGQIPPLLGAWLGNLVFGAGGALLMFKVPK